MNAKLTVRSDMFVDSPQRTVVPVDRKVSDLPGHGAQLVDQRTNVVGNWIACRAARVSVVEAGRLTGCVRSAVAVV